MAMSEISASGLLAWSDPASLGSALASRLAEFLRFDSHVLYFGASGINEPELLPGEGILLLPFGQHGGASVILRLGGVDPARVAPLMPALPAIARLCLENVWLDCARRRDPATFLHTEEALLLALRERIAALQALASSRTVKDACLGMIVIAWPEAFFENGEREARDSFWNYLATAFRNMLPADSVGAGLGRLEGRRELGLLFPAASRGTCQRLARRLLAGLGKYPFRDPASQAENAPRLCAGHALYPQDLSGREFALPAWEQALLLRDRARLAAAAAWGAERLKLPIMAYAWIRVLGGKVAALAGRDRLRVNIGRAAGVKPGQRFHVIGAGAPWSANWAKALIAIEKIRESDSDARIIHINKAGSAPEPGDGLWPIRGAAEGASPGSLASHADFIAAFERESASQASFALAIVKFWPNPEAGKFPENESKAEPGHAKALAALCESFLGANPRGLAGWHCGDSAIFYLPETDAPEAENYFRQLRDAASEAGFESATGIFAYPFLNFSKADSESCALKALEYALLLPSPRIGALNGLALAISADRRFAQGDETGALEEYRQALLLDPDNADILNSTGVCLAALNRMEAARRKFREALERADSKDLRAKANYNLGNILRKEHDLAAARDCFRRCLQAEPGHIYAWTRLGQVYEKAGKPRASRAFYKHASRLAKNDAEALNMAQRQLARLESAANQMEKAREILHEALLRDPADKASLMMLAKTYLEDDPATAEALARECLRLGADAWPILERALAAPGRKP